MTVVAEPPVDDDTPDEAPVVAPCRPRWLADARLGEPRRRPRRRASTACSTPATAGSSTGTTCSTPTPACPRRSGGELRDGRVAARLPRVVDATRCCRATRSSRSSTRSSCCVHVFVSTQEDLAQDGVPRRHVLRRGRHRRHLLRGARGALPAGVRRRRRRRRRPQHPHALLPQPVLADPRRRRRLVHVVHRRAAARSAQAGARPAGHRADVPVHDVRLPARRGVRRRRRRGPARSRPAAPGPPGPRMGADGVRARGGRPARRRCRGCSPSPTCRTSQRPSGTGIGQRRRLHRPRRVVAAVVLAVRSTVHDQLRRHRVHRPADHVLRLDDPGGRRAVRRDAASGSAEHLDLAIAAARAVHRDDRTGDRRADPLAVPLHAVRGDARRAGRDGGDRCTRAGRGATRPFTTTERRVLALSRCGPGAPRLRPAPRRCRPPRYGVRARRRHAAGRVARPSAAGDAARQS